MPSETGCSSSSYKARSLKWNRAPGISIIYSVSSAGGDPDAGAEAAFPGSPSLPHLEAPRPDAPSCVATLAGEFTCDPVAQLPSL